MRTWGSEKRPRIICEVLLQLHQRHLVVQHSTWQELWANLHVALFSSQAFSTQHALTKAFFNYTPHSSTENRKSTKLEKAQYRDAAASYGLLGIFQVDLNGAGLPPSSSRGHFLRVCSTLFFWGHPRVLTCGSLVSKLEEVLGCWLMLLSCSQYWKARVSVCSPIRSWWSYQQACLRSCCYTVMHPAFSTMRHWETPTRRRCTPKTPALQSARVSATAFSVLVA